MIKLGNTEISKVYLGGTEITKVYKGRDLVHGGSPHFVIPYITDGLVFYLDGIEKGSAQGAWTDLVGGIVFNPYTNGVTFNADNVQFGGSSNKALISSVDGSGIIPSNTAGTIEVCFNNTSGTTNKCLFYGGVNSGVCFHIGNTTDIKWSSGNSSTPSIGKHSNQAKTTYSISRDRVIENFSAQTFGSSGYITYKMTKMIVGGSGRSASTIYDVFNGQIYSIRIYNRKLSEAEVLSNQQVDNTRFNLGLAVPNVI